MEELFDMPHEYIEPIYRCFNILQRCNIFIFDKEKSFWKKNWRFIYIMPCVVLYYISLSVEMSKVFNGNIGLVELAYMVTVYVVTNQAFLKIRIVTSKKRDIRGLIVQLGRMWGDSDLTEVQVNKKNALLKKLNLCYTVFYWMNIIGSWQYMLAPLFETVFRKYVLQQECGLLLPFSCSYPFDPSGNWLIYIAVYIFEIYSMFLIVYYYLGCEFLMITLCSHLSTEFTILAEELLHNKTRYGNRYGDYINGIKRIIRRHQKLICLSDQLDDIFNRMIFVNLSSAHITICFFAFSAKVSRGILDMANNFVGVVACIVPIFNVCYYGELLSETSVNMAASAYHDLWYQAGTKYEKLVWFIIISVGQEMATTIFHILYYVDVYVYMIPVILSHRPFNSLPEKILLSEARFVPQAGRFGLLIPRWPDRSQKPCTLTSLKHSAVALTTFTAVLSTTWSYFSLATSLYEEES